MTNAARGQIAGPAGATNCRPDIRKATATEFELVNPWKPSNFIIGELVGGRLSFIVENLPKDPTGCPGRWLFGLMMAHFDPNVHAIQGHWVGPNSDNLIELNRLTALGVPVEDACKQTWTGKRAMEWFFAQVKILSAVGSAGNYTQALVLFTK